MTFFFACTVEIDIGDELVECLVQISAAGKAVAVRLKESSVHRLLDDAAALEAVKSWHFVPASRAGRPLAGSVAVPISFRLDD